MNNDLQHHGIKGQKWGVRRFQNKDGSLTAKGKKRYNDDEYDEERERLEQEVAARRGVKYVRKTKKEREEEDAENERRAKERLAKEDAAYKRTEDKMKEIDKKLQAKYDFNSSDDVDKYYKEYDEEWFKILYEERKKEGLSHSDMSKDELQHHGVKGMKWGVRRYRNRDGSLTPAGKKRYNDSAPAHEHHKRVYDGKKASQLSDQELRDRLNRLNMEKQYSMLTATETKAGKKFVKDVMYNAGKNVATESTKKYMAMGVAFVAGLVAKNEKVQETTKKAASAVSKAIAKRK